MAVPERLAGWLAEHTGVTGDWQLRRLAGGNSNETCLISTADRSFVLRRPPQHALSASAHSVSREYRLLTALAEANVPSPQPIALCEDTEVPMAPFLVMEHVADAVSLTDQLPPDYGPEAMTAVADQFADALAAAHRLDWRAAGLADFGKPENFLARQPKRWHGQWEKIASRPLPAMDRLADWLSTNQPPENEPGLLHGDFHLDNCLFAAAQPRLLVILDWEMSTIGDPLLDLGLTLAFWGERLIEHPAMPRIQGVSRLPGAPSKQYLLQRYESALGKLVPHVDYYQVLAFFKLAAIVEAAYSQYLAGDLRTEYAAALEHDVPALLAEAEAIAGR